MSLFNDNAGNAHVSISTPGAIAHLPNGAFTIGFLHKFKIFEGSGNMFYAYRPDGFCTFNVFIDGDVWVAFNSFDSNFPTGPEDWHWVVVTRDAVAEPARAHVASYSESGGLTWMHGDCDGAHPITGDMNRLSIGDEFGPIMRGNMAVLTAYMTEMSDAQVESTFLRSSSQLLAASPDFFLHWPEADGVVFDELVGGGEVVPGTLTGAWSVTPDPPGYDFSLAPARAGRIKIDGVAYPTKVWNGSAWVEHPVKGYNGTDWVLSK